MIESETRSAVPGGEAQGGTAHSSNRVGGGGRRGLPYLVAGVAFVIYAVWSVTLQRTFQTTGLDLGLFEQAVRSYAEGQWPVSDLKMPGYPLLGDHFSPILAVLAPFYLLWPSAVTLLVAQAALIAVSAIPVTRVAVGVLGRNAGLAVAAGYVLSAGLVRTITCDFHEVCFAVPLLAFAVERLYRRQWGAAVAWAAPLVLVKEDLPMTIAAIGVYLVWQGQRRLGWATVAAGVLTTGLIMKVVLPAINSRGGYAYGDKLSHLAPFDGIGMKLLTLTVLLAPTAFVALRSPLVILVIPTLGWRMISDFTFYWTPSFYYDAVLIPIVFLAALDGITRMRRPWPRRAVPICAVVAAIGATTVWMVHDNQPRWTTAQQAAADQILTRIPDGATVAAANRLAPHLTSRHRVLFYPTYPNQAERPEWIAATKPEKAWPLSVSEQADLLKRLQETDYTMVAENSTVLLLQRKTDQPASVTVPVTSTSGLTSSG
ncbi:DUF2079 domain-containing protein [Amycolatopsis jejuensis]|uniref:DUF2079 domain-containing protein n=1 Tax=Amycolatopsis jejuensis TaxID=330084 RepID=UPI0007C4BE51|nr:DUF2079 domain-containing protein [Amycolatopsis jejuensis]